MNAPAYLRYALAVAVVAALGAFATSAAYAMEPLRVTITNSGIVTDVDHTAGGLYAVTVKNDTCDARGIVMKGLDRGGSRFLRFTKVLGPGESQSFRWYFPAGRGDVRLRDLLCCTHEKFTCVLAGYGGLTTSLRFG